jgi:hypothetical protein
VAARRCDALWRHTRGDLFLRGHQRPDGAVAASLIAAREHTVVPVPVPVALGAWRGTEPRI